MKNIEEVFAKKILCEVLNLKSENFISKESPDFHNEIDSIGLEVTRAMDEQDGLTQMIVREYFGKNKSTNEIKEEVNLLNKKNKFKGKVGKLGRYTYVSPTRGLTDTMNVIEKIKVSVEKKILLFNKYRKFNKNILFVILKDHIINENDIKYIIDSLDNNPYEQIIFQKYNIIYVCSSDKIKEVILSEETIKNIWDELNKLTYPN